MISMKSFILVLLVAGHLVTQLGLTLPDQTWRPWLQAHLSQEVAAGFWLLFATRLAADLGICFWLLGPERRKHVWTTLRK